MGAVEGIQEERNTSWIVQLGSLRVGIIGRFVQTGRLVGASGPTVIGDRKSGRVTLKEAGEWNNRRSGGKAKIGTFV